MPLTKVDSSGIYGSYEGHSIEFKFVSQPLTTWVNEIQQKEDAVYTLVQTLILHG